MFKIERDMHRYIPIFFFVFGSLILLASIFGEDGLPSLKAARASLATQEEMNRKLREHVSSLRIYVDQLMTDDRVLEKTARDELGMARPNEKVFIFDEE